MPNFRGPGRQACGHLSCVLVKESRLPLSAIECCILNAINLTSEVKLVVARLPELSGLLEPYRTPLPRALEVAASHLSAALAVVGGWARMVDEANEVAAELPDGFVCDDAEEQGGGGPN